MPAARTGRSRRITWAQQGSAPGLLPRNEELFLQKIPLPLSLLPIATRNTVLTLHPAPPHYQHHSDLPLPSVLPQETAWGAAGYGETRAPPSLCLTAAGDAPGAGFPSSVPSSHAGIAALGRRAPAQPFDFPWLGKRRAKRAALLTSARS